PGVGLRNTRARGGGRPPRAGRVLLFRRMRSPAAFAPLPKTGTLGAQSGVASVSGIDPRVIGHRPEHTLLHIAEQCPKVLVGPGPTDTTGKEAVPGEQVGVPLGVVITQSDRPRGVPPKVEHGERTVTDGDTAPVHD